MDDIISVPPSNPARTETKFVLFRMLRSPATICQRPPRRHHRQDPPPALRLHRQQPDFAATTASPGASPLNVERIFLGRFDLVYRNVLVGIGRP